METTIQSKKYDTAHAQTTVPVKRKTTKIIYWVSTGLLSLFFLSGAFFINSKMALDAMHHLGVPEWFRWGSKHWSHYRRTIAHTSCLATAERMELCGYWY